MAEKTPDLCAMKALLDKFLEVAEEYKTWKIENERSAETTKASAETARAVSPMVP